VSYLLDTCVVSELVRQTPNPKAIEWLRNAAETELYLSVVTIGELHKGIEKLPSTRRKKELAAWLNQDLLARFRQRLMALDLSVMLTWGTLAARVEATGRKMPVVDALIAATALNSKLTLVTRNVGDFAQSGVAIVNPWE
jgi:predicted nucleic acid-binding protein